MDPKFSADMLFVTQAFLIQFSQERKERCKLQNLTLDHDQLHQFPSNNSLAPNWVLLRMLSPWPSAAKKKPGGKKSGTATPPCLLTQQTQGHHRNSSASTQSEKQGRCTARRQTLQNGRLAQCKMGRNFFFFLI